MPELPRRNPDGTFNSDSDAYEWAVCILQLNRGAKGTCWEYTGASHGDYMRLDAIAVMAVAERYDASTPGRFSWLSDYYLPEPTEPPPRWTDHEMLRLLDLVAGFQCGLALKGFLKHCRANCEEKKKVDRTRKMAVI